MKTLICLIRHGQTDWNKQLIIQGQIDNQLNDEGRSQIAKLAERLKENNYNFDIIISSPLSRAIESANILKKNLNINTDVIIDNDIIERDFGEAEGCKICPEIYDRIKKDDIIGIEKGHDLSVRAYNAILKIVKLYPNKNILITSHSHFIKGLYNYITPEINYSTSLYNASINTIIFEDDKIIEYNFNK